MRSAWRTARGGRGPADDPHRRSASSGLRTIVGVDKVVELTTLAAGKEQIAKVKKLLNHLRVLQNDEFRPRTFCVPSNFRNNFCQKIISVLQPGGVAMWAIRITIYRCSYAVVLITRTLVAAACIQHSVYTPSQRVRERTFDHRQVHASLDVTLTLCCIATQKPLDARIALRLIRLD